MNKSNTTKLHPRLGQIVDLELLQNMYKLQDDIDSHVEAVDVQLDEFYRQTGTDEEFFEETGAPKVSKDIFAKWVELYHTKFYLAPSYQYVTNFIELAVKVNQMLQTHDFDYSLKYYEKNIAEIDEKRTEAQIQRAMADAIQQLQIHNFTKWREDKNAKLTDADRKLMFRYAAEFLKDDHGWGEKEADEVLAVGDY